MPDGDSFTAVCEVCEQEWTEEEQEENTGSPEPPERCIYCGAADVIVEA